MIWNILFIIMMFILGGSVGGLITLRVLDKTVNDLIKSYEDFVKTQNKIMELDTNIIREYAKVILDTYVYLVNLRDKDEGDLDEIIGALGALLDDHKEEDSDEPNSDRETTVQEG